MIFAEAIVTKNEPGLRLVVNYPDGHKVNASAVNEGEAKRLVYFYNRLYISDTLTHWLNQRKNVFTHVNDPRSADAEVLISQVRNYSKTSLKQLCELVIKKEQAISGIAPGTKSRHYGNYERLIIPIIRFCKQMKGIEV
ncbi:hypothetical protein [Mucilaginibacter sp.]